MAAFRLTLVRHGETAHNKSHIIQGQLDVPLSSVGIQQAKLVGQHLCQEQWTHVFTSDLSRAKQTAEEIVKCNPLFEGSITCDPRLRERKFGELQGKEFSIMKELAAKAGKKVFDYVPPGGETLKEVRSRAKSFFTSLCQDMLSRQQGKIVNGHVNSVDPSTQSSPNNCDLGIHVSPADANVLIVCHGGFILELLHYFVEDLKCKLPIEKNQALRISPNAAVSKFVASVNESGDLQDIICELIHYTDHMTRQSANSAAAGDTSSSSDVSL